MRGAQLTVGDKGSTRSDPSTLKPSEYFVGVGVSGQGVDVANIGDDRDILAVDPNGSGT